jgi:hypothetical protein
MIPSISRLAHRCDNASCPLLRLGKDSHQIGVTKKVKLWDKVHALTTPARHFQLLEPKEESKRWNGNNAGRKSVVIT